MLMLSTQGASRAETRGGDSRLLQIVRAYADTLIERGRDIYGDQHSPLFAEALDRRTLRLLDGDALKKAEALTFKEWGIRPHDRMLRGANPMHCENLYQVLAALTDVTGVKRYAAEADLSLAFFLTHCQSPATGLFYWGEHAGWDFRSDVPLTGRVNCNIHEFYRPWILWEWSWRLAADACLKFARGLWEHQIADHETGDYSRHAAIDKHGPGTGAPYPRHGGCYVETWAFAYKKTRDPLFLKAIETVVDGLERMRRGRGMIAGNSVQRNPAYVQRSEALAVSLWDAAASLPEPLATKLREIALANDAPDTAGSGVKIKSSNLWSDGYGGFGGELAGHANLLALRYRQRQLQRYRQRILGVADAYRTASLNLSFPVYPGTFGKVILLMLNAQALTGDARYADRADELADQAVGLFLSDGCALPKASHVHDHYEAVTSADTLMMSLLQLWAARQAPARQLRLIYTDR